jgi:hypothetical protein
LDALRSLGGEAGPKDVFDWVRRHNAVSESELSGVNSNGQSKFENKVSWARFYLTKAGLIDAPHGPRLGAGQEFTPEPFTKE